jgi:hypothetical protein
MSVNEPVVWLSAQVRPLALHRYSLALLATRARVWAVRLRFCTPLSDEPRRWGRGDRSFPQGLKFSSLCMHCRWM